RLETGRRQGRTGAPEQVGVNKIMRRLANEDDVPKTFRKGTPIIKRDPACRRNFAHVGEQLWIRIGGDRKYLRGFSVVRDRGRGVGDEQVGPALEISRRNDLLINVVAVVHVKRPAPAIERESKLRPPRKRFKPAPIRLEPHV